MLVAKRNFVKAQAVRPDIVASSLESDGNGMSKRSPHGCFTGKPVRSKNFDKAGKREPTPGESHISQKHLAKRG